MTIYLRFLNIFKRFKNSLGMFNSRTGHFLKSSETAKYRGFRVLFLPNFYFGLHLVKWPTLPTIYGKT